MAAASGRDGVNSAGDANLPHIYEYVTAASPRNPFQAIFFVIRQRLAGFVHFTPLGTSVDLAQCIASNVSFMLDTLSPSLPLSEDEIGLTTSADATFFADLADLSVFVDDRDRLEVRLCFLKEMPFSFYILI